MSRGYEDQRGSSHLSSNRANEHRVPPIPPVPLPRASMSHQSYPNRSGVDDWGTQLPAVMPSNSSSGRWSYGSNDGPNDPSHSPDSYRSQGRALYNVDPSATPSAIHPATQPQRRPSNRDEFDGPAQYLPKPVNADQEPTEEDLPALPIHLYSHEQDEILSRVNDRLSQCAYDFVARYSFPIPLEPDKRPVSVPSDREWSEWVFLLKRLATKRRIPARVLFNGQIRQFITVLENSLEMRHAAMHQSRPLKDDRNVLQLISSGIQVAKIVKDANAMRFLDSLYVQTECLIASREI